MEGKEKWILGVGLVFVLCLSATNFASLNAIKKTKKQGKNTQTSLRRKFNLKQKQIKKAFNDAEKNFKTTKKNFETIEGRLGRLEQELLNVRGDLLKMRTKIKERARKIRGKMLEEKILEKKRSVMPTSENFIEDLTPIAPDQ
ncbi:MAG: hypothetical protein KAS87_03400 [Candidatus Omnitrophica bacterium]|nr:hypothetical protein [Candidatus Omnitrophota bacterium]